MQEKETLNPIDFSDFSACPDRGRIISLDWGTKKIGLAACDESQSIIRPLEVIERSGWKKLLSRIIGIIGELDAAALVIGLPLNMDESDNELSLEVRKIARNFSLSLDIPVFLQDERLTTKAASENLYEQGIHGKERLKRLDTEAASLILGDFLDLKKSSK